MSIVGYRVDSDVFLLDFSPFRKFYLLIIQCSFVQLLAQHQSSTHVLVKLISLGLKYFPVTILLQRQY